MAPGNSLLKELLALLEGVGVAHVGVLVRKLVRPPGRAPALPHVQLTFHLVFHKPGTSIIPVWGSGSELRLGPKSPEAHQDREPVHSE